MERCIQAIMKRCIQADSHRTLHPGHHETLHPGVKLLYSASALSGAHMTSPFGVITKSLGLSGTASILVTTLCDEGRWAGSFCHVCRIISFKPSILT